jgi:uncharacterized protein YegJ (DUF2314 family)
MHLKPLSPAWLWCLAAVAVAAASAGAGTASAQTLVEKASKDDVEWVAKESPAMKAAFQRARDSLPEFLALIRSKPTGISDPSLKVAVTDGGAVEYFWVGAIEVTSAGFTGVLNNQPRVVFKHRMGDRFSFARDQVVDWMYYRDGGRRMVGNFTACAILSGRPQKEVDEFKLRYGLSCD